ncbi:MAG: hypothetical protein JST67_11780 [Bacteroidetes bacterium]|nr:hypothetical protein [Bacteroidota bacterium]
MEKYPLHITDVFNPNELKNGIYLVLLHANYSPPHIGLLIENYYHSLTIKGQELNIKSDVFLKNIALRKIGTAFIKIKKHPVFSNQHLQEAFAEQVKLFDKVNGDVNTCLSPVRLFFEDFYALKKERITLIFDLLKILEENSFIEKTTCTHLIIPDKNILYLDIYNTTHLKEKIALELQKEKTQKSF